MTIRNSNPNAFTYSPECIAYSQFRREWRANYKKLSQNIREQKAKVAELYRQDKPHTAANAQSALAYMRAQATGQMSVLDEKKSTWKALLEAGHQWRSPSEALAAAE